MKYSRVFMDSLGYELAPIVVSSDELEDHLEPVYRALRIPKGQLVAWTGIEERRWWEAGFPPSLGAAKAARNALAKSNVAPHEIDIIIYGGVCRDEFEPATASHVAAELGLNPRAGVYDISNACLGVLNGIIDVANRIELGQIRAGLVVSCESARDIVEIMISRMLARPEMEYFKLSLATLTGGSGAVAVVVTDGSFGQERRRLLGGVQHCATQHHMLCRWGIDDEGREFTSTDSVAVLEHGVELGGRTWTTFLSELEWTPSSLEATICHQVGSAHQSRILESLGLNKENDFCTYPYLGNMGTAALPVAAAIAEDRGFLTPGMTVGFLGIGSGLNCMMLGWQW